MKKILVVCGAGLVTATLICKDIETILNNHQLEATVVACKASDAGMWMDSVDVIVTSLHFGKDADKPIVALQSLFGLDYQYQLEEKLLELLKH